jgi:hypothetical protein
MQSTKIVLHSVSGYTPAQDTLLTSILDKGLGLFCTFGKDCGRWEDAMDSLCEQRGGRALQVVTTSHPGETKDDVMAFAHQWPGAGAIELLEV